MTVTQIASHSRHQLAGENLEINPVAELRRDSELPHLFVSSLLPAIQLGRDIDRLTLVIEPYGLWIDNVGGSFACNVASVRSPLAFHFASRIRYANRTTLVVRAGASIHPRSFLAGATPCLRGHPSVKHDSLEEHGPSRVSAPRLWDRRLPRPAAESPSRRHSARFTRSCRAPSEPPTIAWPADFTNR